MQGCSLYSVQLTCLVKHQLKFTLGIFHHLANAFLKLRQPVFMYL